MSRPRQITALLESWQRPTRRSKKPFIGARSDQTSEEFYMPSEESRQESHRTIFNRAIRESVDKLLEQAGYQPDSSARHQLSMMNFDAEPAQHPVYAYRRKGQDSFATCEKARYEELSGKPDLFEVTVFYATSSVKTSESLKDSLRNIKMAAQKAADGSELEVYKYTNVQSGYTEYSADDNKYETERLSGFVVIERIAVQDLEYLPQEEQPAQHGPRIAELEETVRQLNRALREATEAPTFMGEPVQNRLTDEQTLDVMGQRIGYGRIQQIAGQLWDVRHGCAPRDSMGVTVKDSAPPQRKPLTAAELKRVIEAAPVPPNPDDIGRWVVNVCRGVEAAHKITDRKT